MRRRVKEADQVDAMPQHLQVFNAADWPHPEQFAACGHVPCAFWAALDEWDETHDVEAGAGPLIIDGPNVPFHEGELVTVRHGIVTPY